MARNYTPAERALALIGALAGVSLDEVNAVLASSAVKMGGQPRAIPFGSYTMLVERYGQKFVDVERDVWERAWKHATSPKSMADLNRDEELMLVVNVSPEMLG